MIHRWSRRRRFETSYAAGCHLRLVISQIHQDLRGRYNRNIYLNNMHRSNYFPYLYVFRMAYLVVGVR